MTKRVFTAVADTGYLLSFGAVRRGHQLLKLLHAGSMCAPEAVHRELDRQSGTGYRGRSAVRSAAQTFSGTARAMVGVETLLNGDLPVIVDVYEEIRDEDISRARERQARQQRREGARGEDARPQSEAPSGVPEEEVAPWDPTLPPQEYDGKNAGEVQTICVATRCHYTVLINEASGTTVARRRQLSVESAAESLGRLPQDRFTDNQLYQIYREMEQKLDTPGLVIRSAAEFRQLRR